MLRQISHAEDAILKSDYDAQSASFYLKRGLDE